ncbi:hypothetical protein J7E51_27660 [Priestia megaterium]|nr:hypothetical protein [Priestia megaterium]
MSIVLNKYKKKYYPISSSKLDSELKAYVLRKLRESSWKVETSFLNQSNANEINDSRYELSDTIQRLKEKVYLNEELTNEELEHLNNFVFLRYPRYSFSLTFGPYIILGLIIGIVYFFYGVLT